MEASDAQTLLLVSSCGGGDTATKASRKVKNEAMPKSQETMQVDNKFGGNLQSPTQPICFDGSTPENAVLASGPLKKRIKHRYSVDSADSLVPFTPSDLYDSTRDIFFERKQPLVTGHGIQTPPFRMPLMDVSTNVTTTSSNVVHGGRSHRTKEATLLAVEFSSEKQSKKKFEDANSLNRSDASTPIKRRHKQSKTPNIMCPALSASPTRLVGPARAHPTFLLPLHTPIRCEKKNDIQQSLGGRKNVFVDDEAPYNYVTLMRQQLEFFELSSEEVAFCKARNLSVTEGQVALRCRHCSCISIVFRPTGSLVVAKKHKSLYKHFNDGNNIHIEELCPFVPKTTKKNLENLRVVQQQHSLAPGEASYWENFGYWCSRAKAEGVVETSGGLRFKSSMLLEKGADRDKEQVPRN